MKHQEVRPARVGDILTLGFGSGLEIMSMSDTAISCRDTNDGSIRTFLAESYWPKETEGGERVSMPWE